MAESTLVTNCRSCDSTSLETVIDLGNTPIANAILAMNADFALEETFPLVVAVCLVCRLVQLLHQLPAGAIFNADYPYYSSFSDDLCLHASEHASHLISQRALTKENFVVEVASNDGYLLRNFTEKGIRVLGIDPSPGPAAEAIKVGVPTIVEFFGVDVATQVRAEHGPADVIIANNVMAHVPSLNDFVAGFAVLLADEGVLTVENPSVSELIDGIEFDTIYHEHYCYFSCLTVDSLMRRHGLFLNDVEFFASLHGGSFRWHMEKTERPTDRLVARLAQERANGLETSEYYASLSHRVKQASNELLDLLKKLKAGGSSIAGYGAAAKGSTLLNTIGIDSEYLDYVVDRNVHKQNHLMPGVHIPIYDVTALGEKPVDYLLLLAWNFKEEIMRQQAAFAERGGKFITPLPTPVVL